MPTPTPVPSPRPGRARPIDDVVIDLIRAETFTTEWALPDHAPEQVRVGTSTSGERD